MSAPARASGAPFLHRIESLREKIDQTKHPFNIPRYPGAVLFSLDGDAIQEVDFRETKHFLITRDFLSSPERFFKHLFGTVDPGPDGS